ncbi:hypothetical protein CRE_23020 [Caenorhabditis remanei]|uniref:Uncharacterized protein n=1 Tax=Caenorhabditis remanei TaxID=31234 RepID=E3N4D9_CAERE|nr:hypothetical protein CRE_23020 [Caenorhabditis remanei]
MQNGNFFHPYRMQQQPGQGDWNAFHQRQMQMVAYPPVPDFEAQRRQKKWTHTFHREELNNF